MKINALLIISSAFFISGCAKTPYQDDYTQHVNKLSETHLSNVDYRFEDSSKVDLRGIYVEDNDVQSAQLLYVGGAGIAGLVAQIGAHSSIVNSQRNEKLSAQQLEANKSIEPLINKAKEMSLQSLFNEGLANNDTIKTSPNTFIIKPIFFSNKQMNQLSLKAIAWLPNNNKKRKKRDKFTYKNLIHVYSKTLSDDESNLLISDTGSDNLKVLLSNLLNKAVNILKSEISGKYKRHNKKAETFVIQENTKNRVIRGAVVASDCEYYVIQDLHNWLIAYPKGSSINTKSDDFLACNT